MEEKKGNLRRIQRSVAILEIFGMDIGRQIECRLLHDDTVFTLSDPGKVGIKTDY